MSSFTEIYCMLEMMQNIDLNLHLVQSLTYTLCEAQSIPRADFNIHEVLSLVDTSYGLQWTRDTADG